MQKIILLLSSFFISKHCFSQLQNNNDSTKPKSGLTHNAIGHIQNGLAPELSIYPNPAKNKITVQVKNFDPGMAMVKVLDIKGKLVREDNRLLTNGTEEVIMFLLLKAGVYFIILSEPAKIARKKLVIF